MPLYEIDTRVVFEHKYIIDAESMTDAINAVNNQDNLALTELFQNALPEEILAGKQITREDFDDLISDENNDSTWSHTYLGDKVINKV